MFGIGGTELLVILLIALVVAGPKSLPKIARTLGKAFGEFRHVSTEFQRAINLEAALEDEKKVKPSKKPTQQASISTYETENMSADITNTNKKTDA